MCRLVDRSVCDWLGVPVGGSVSQSVDRLIGLIVHGLVGWLAGWSANDRSAVRHRPVGCLLVDQSVGCYVKQGNRDISSATCVFACRSVDLVRRMCRRIGHSVVDWSDWLVGGSASLSADRLIDCCPPPG